MKYCPKCNQQKSLNNFAFKNKRRRLLLTYCKECNREYQRIHYRTHLADYKQKSGRYKEFIRRENRLKIIEYLGENPCVDCGEGDFRVLEFDHVRGDKRQPVSILHSNALSWRTLFKEIKKCEVRCANCHKRRTAKQFGWYLNIENDLQTARSSIG